MRTLDVHPIVQLLRELQARNEAAEEAAYWEWHYSEGISLTDPDKQRADHRQEWKP